MRKLALLAAASFAAMAAVPASAAVVVYNGTSYNPTDVIPTISFTGVNNPGAHATLSLTFNSVDANGDYLFSYSLTNTSDAATNGGSNVSAFGFNIDPSTFNIGNSDVDAIVGDIDGIGAGSIANGYSVEFCATAGPNCAGGASGGPDLNQTFTGTFLLAFNGADPGTITLSQPLVRFQNTGPINSSDTGTPNETPPVPEPATWAMMLVGFGATGVAMRRGRRRKALLAQIA